jgi:alkylhydroperoxidase family enzyme
VPRVEPVPYEELSDQYRTFIEAGADSGAFTTPVPLQILAYADHPPLADDVERHPNFPNSLLEPRLLELLRIRSGQLGGCEPCMGSRKEGSISDDDVACLMNPALRPDLTPREVLALAFIDQLSADHWAIGDETFLSLHEVFTTAEIMDLGQTVGGMIGYHRFLHTLDAFGEQDPVIKYDPNEVGATWDSLHGS